MPVVFKGESPTGERKPNSKFGASRAEKLEPLKMRLSNSTLL
jgi:hypothetical protein